MLVTLHSLGQSLAASFTARLAGVFFLSWLALAFYLSLGTFTSTDDQFFNIRLAAQVAEEGFPALLTFHGFTYSEHQPWIYNTLFYYLLVPFTLAEPLEQGIKLFSVTAVALILTLCYAFLDRRRVAHPAVWTVAIAALFWTYAGFWHLLMARAFVLVPALLILLLIALDQKRSAWAAPIAALGFFVHSATFFFAPLVAGLYGLVALQARERYALRPFSYAAGGLAAALGAALLLMPDFKRLFWDFLVTLRDIITSFHASQGPLIAEGLESYPFSLFDLAQHYPFVTALALALVVAETGRLLALLRRSEPVADPLRTTLYLLTIVFLLGTFLTRRNLDFFLVIGSLFVVVNLDAGLKTLQAGWPLRLRSGVAVALGVMLVAQLLALAAAISTGRAYQLMQGPALWLREQTPAGSAVYIPSINLFPTLYFYNEGHNRVPVGIEPRNLYRHDPERYWLWYHLGSAGIVCRQPSCAAELDAKAAAQQGAGWDEWQEEQGKQIARVLQEEFATDIVLVRDDFTALNQTLSGAPAFEKVYETPVTAHYRIFRVKP